MAWLGQFTRRFPREAGVPIETLLTPGFVAIDVETTGLNPRKDALVAVAALPFVDGTPRPGFVSLVNPGRPIPATATAVHRIHDRDVKHAPNVSDVMPHFDALCSGRVVVGHDVAFDLSVLAAARAHLGLRQPSVVALDTRRLLRAVDPTIRDSRLEVVARRLGLPTTGRHTADGDALMAGTIFQRLLPALRARGARTVTDLLRLQRGTMLYD